MWDEGAFEDGSQWDGYTEQGTMLQHLNNVRQAAAKRTGMKLGMNANKGATAVNNMIEGLRDKVV